MNNYKYYPYVDYIKVFGLLLVIIGHSIQHSYLLVFLYSFHMPLFFFISGFFSKKNYCIALNKQIRTLLIPYILLCLISILPTSLILYYTSNIPIIQSIYNCLSFVKGYPYSFSGPLWFVFSLFFIKLFFNISQKLKIDRYTAIIVFIASIVLYYKENIHTISSLECIIFSYSFFYIGHVYGNTRIHLNWINKSYFWSITFIFFLISVYLNGYVDIKLHNYGSNIFLYYINGCIGTILTFTIFRQLFKKETKIITILCRGSIIVMAFHKYFISMFSYYNIFFSILISVICLLAFIYPIKFIIKRCPILIGYRNYNVSQDLGKT